MGKLIEIYGGVVHRANFKVSPIRNIIDNSFALRQKYKDEKRGNAIVSEVIDELII